MTTIDVQNVVHGDTDCVIKLVEGIIHGPSRGTSTPEYPFDSPSSFLITLGLLVMLVIVEVEMVDEMYLTAHFDRMLDSVCNLSCLLGVLWQTSADPHPFRTFCVLATH